MFPSIRSKIRMIYICKSIKNNFEKVKRNGLKVVMLVEFCLNVIIISK